MHHPVLARLDLVAPTNVFQTIVVVVERSDKVYERVAPSKFLPSRNGLKLVS